MYVFFRCGHTRLRNRPTILVSLESTGPYQRNGASLVFMRDVVLEIQVIVILGIRMRRVCLAQKNIRKYASRYVVTTCSLYVLGAGDEI